MSALWDDSNRPALGAMASTTTFEDNAAGDTTTYEEASDSETFGAGCAQHSAFAEITGVLDLGSVVDILSYQVTYRQEADIGNAAICAGTGLDEGFEGWEDTRAWWLEVSSNGTTWTELDSQPEQFATFTAGVLTRNHTYQQTISDALPPGTSGRYLRFYTYIQVTSYDQSDTVYAKARISDMRVTSTEPDPEDEPPPGIACEEIGAEYGQSAGGDPQITVTIS